VPALPRNGTGKVLKTELRANFLEKHAAAKAADVE
jgi:acyl-coenzyme A synthetase/AMP-(fatty) acid ligase